MDNQTLIFATIFGAIALVGYFVYAMLSGGSEEKLHDRLIGNAETDGTDAAAAAAAGAGDGSGVVMPLLQKVGTAAAEPFMPKSREAQGELRQRLGYAGYYSTSSLKLMTGSKVILLGLGLIGGYFGSTFVDTFFMQMAILAVGGLVGYLAPTFWLKHAIKANRKGLTYGLADALDLMVVCVEAGLTIDSAMQRVGQEMSLAHPAIARELGICHMETRMGLSRSEALKNLGVRTGCEALVSLSSMLIQADRFGTSIATALRIHADTIRTNRHHAAEELAAKASVKMSFPLVLFIFPATFIVLAGPTVIQLMDSPLMN
jgi:tight adherence protein C